MPGLFIDTSDELIVALISDDYKFLKQVNRGKIKTSKEIHKIIYDTLTEYDLFLDSIGFIFNISGPGSYTGMRVGEGISQLLEWQSIPTYSFNHFQIPYLLGEKEGVWVSNAFKSEFFIYSWKGEENAIKLVHEKEIVNQLDYINKSNVNIFCKNNELGLLDIDFHETSLLIAEESEKLFSIVRKKRLRETPFYYRTAEKEFKVKS